MVRNGQADERGIPKIVYAAPPGTPQGIEVMTLAALRSRATPENLVRPLRPDFHHLLTVDHGRLHLFVDFTSYTLDPGQWLWIRPRQVLQWPDLTHVQGTLILFQEEFLDPATITATGADDPFAPGHVTPDFPDLQVLHQAARHLTDEFATRSRMSPNAHLAVLRHLLAALLLRLSPTAVPALAPDGTTRIFHRFHNAVEQHYVTSRAVGDYAIRLGYSTRTLTRASLAVTGTGAKEIIDQRVILEAKRLLAHTDHAAAQIAYRLGFASATNFTKYFHKRTGQTPIAFRTSTVAR